MCLTDSWCFRFEPPPPKPGAMMSTLICVRCGFHANDHENLGSKGAEEPDLVDERGRCFRIRMLGGGGVHDAPQLQVELMAGAEPPPRPARKVSVAARTGAASALPPVAHGWGCCGVGVALSLIHI